MPSKGVRPARKVLGVLPEKVEEEKKKATFFWPYLELSDELISMAPQAIKDKHNELGPFNYEPFPAPDHINRTFKRINYDDGRIYEGEVDELGRQDGRGVKLVPSEYFYEGYFICDKRNGRGREIEVDGSNYYGEWKDDVCHGFGL